MGKRIARGKAVRSLGSIKGLHEVCVHTFQARLVIITVFPARKCRHRVGGELSTMKQERVKELSERDHGTEAG